MSSIPAVIKQLNNIFNNPDTLEQFRLYLTDRWKYNNPKYTKKFGKALYTYFTLKDDQLVYTNKHLHLSLIVVEDDEQRLNISNELFHNDTNAYGKGINNLYKYVTTNTLTLHDIKDFVATKNDYQLTEPITKRTNKPIISKYPNELWSIDLIDLNEYASTNRQWRYIMTVVNVFSRRCWLRKLKKKEATHTRDAFEGIIRQEDVSPKFLLSDNGTEFLGEFQEYC
jgi:hypothetical protein